MKKILSIIAIVLSLNSLTFAQDLTLKEYDLHAGIAFPNSPDKFYDYWKTGFVVGGGAGFSVTDVSSIIVSADYARFTLDKERFFKGIKLPIEGSSISGAATSVIAFSGMFKYAPPSETLPLYILGGASLELSSIANSTVTYTNYTTTKETQNNLVFSVGLGFGFSSRLNSTMDWYFEAKHFFGILKKENANAIFSPVIVGIKSAL